jgi:flagellar P-ring protein precursor FlgI
VQRVTIFILLLVLGRTAAGDTLGDIVRLEGQQANTLVGLGLVFGLPGTGDSGEELATARPLMEVLTQMGNAPQSLEELADSRSVALVMVKAVVPLGGARVGDTIDVRISAMGSASSLAGGELFIAPLRYEVRGPVELDRPLAIAQGTVAVDDPAVTTNAMIPDGARMLQDLKLDRLGSSFTLLIDRHFAGHAAAVTIANRINQEWFGTLDLFGPVVATPVDDRAVRIDVPEDQRGQVPGFVAEILGYRIDLRDLGLPARVVANRRTGVIVVTGAVRVAPVAITHKDLSITTTLPEPVPTPNAPLARLETWVGVGTGARPDETAQLSDLLAALERLDVPVEDQIDILLALRRSGHLQAELIVE